MKDRFLTASEDQSCICHGDGIAAITTIYENFLSMQQPIVVRTHTALYHTETFTRLYATLSVVSELLQFLCRATAVFLDLCNYNFLSLFTGDMRYPSFASFSRNSSIVLLLLRHEKSIEQYDLR